MHLTDVTAINEVMRLLIVFICYDFILHSADMLVVCYHIFQIFIPSL